MLVSMDTKAVITPKIGKMMNESKLASFILRYKMDQRIWEMETLQGNIRFVKIYWAT